MASAKQSARNLYDLAAGQQGFFTPKQAKAAGYRDSVHGYHVANGDWERVYRGIYRLTLYPAAAWPELVIWSLWSRGRSDEPVGVFSHETALQIHGVAARRPGRLHLTVPPDFRKGSALPEALHLHYDNLQEEDVIAGAGFRFTSLRRARADLRGVALPPEAVAEGPVRAGPRPRAAGERAWAVW